ncbi:MerR family transcriptional regulator [Actinokineospora pegani]|uniref:MerR family transcriptional regulator n=1 Tax=Actinokineospora pegani TaxID=2654637 RepID=UPI0012E9A2A2|nr:MerR family transcriptional regulator [Actinokineospora pegani]
MAWSTKQLADLAGTTLRAVRHYHEVGLLAEPERRANGYKSYSVTHLVRVLRIKRLSELGFSLAQIATMDDADQRPEEELRALDAELAATIERLRRVRAELGVILDGGAPTDLPAELAEATANADLSEADRSFVLAMTRVLGPRSLEAYGSLLRAEGTDPLDAEFDELPADADEQARGDLAERMLPRVLEVLREYPALSEVGPDAPHSQRFTSNTIDMAITDLYNTAQQDVLGRIRQNLAELVQQARREERPGRAPGEQEQGIRQA